MPTTITIPQVTISGTAKTFAHSVPVGATAFSVSLDVSSLPPSDLLYMEIDISYDNGATWNVLASKYQFGGTSPSDGGGTTTDAFMQGPIGGDPNSTQRQARGLVKTTLGDGVTPGPSYTSTGGQLVIQ